MNDLARAIQTLEGERPGAPSGVFPNAPSSVFPDALSGGEDRFDLAERMAQHKVPGFSLALIDQGEVAWSKGYGVVEAGSDRPVMADTIFQAASISKLVTALVALHLVEAGRLDLDVDTNVFLRSWQVPESKYLRPMRDGTQPQVTLRGLLSHTSGMGVSGYRGYVAGSELPDLVQILNGEPPARSRPVKLKQRPGKGFSYSGGGYMVVQMMIEDSSCRTLADLAREVVFEPLGMEQSTFDSVPPERLLAQAASGHNSKGKVVKGKWHIYPEQATASLWSTPPDLARLAVEVVRSFRGESNKVLSVEMTREMLTPQISWIGLGFPLIEEDGTKKFEHPGWNMGYHSLLVCGFEGGADAGRGIAWMSNGENGKLLGREVMAVLPDGFGWKVY